MICRDQLTPHDLGSIHGQALGALALEMRRNGLPAEAWNEFMTHRLATMQLQYDTPQERQEWVQGCLEAYHRTIKGIPSLLELLEPEGHA